MNLIQELLNILDRKEDKKSLDLKKDWFEFGRTKPSSLGNPLYSPRMTPHAIRFDNLVASIEENLSATSEIGKAIYNIKYSNDNSVVPANGQVIYNQASREIYVSKIDALGNDREIAFDTILLTEGNPGVKPVGLFWANQLNPWTSYSSQYFNTCGSEFLKFVCGEPTSGDTFIFNPGNGPVGNNGGTGIPIDLVYAQTEQGLMTGGSGASLVTVYIEPLIASQTIQVARRNAAGIQFVFEQIASPAALMTAYYNQDYVTVDPSIAGNNWWGMYTDSAMTSPVGDGFYMLHTEWLAMSGGDYGHITSISGGNYLQTSKTFLNTNLNDPSGDPDLVCTAVTRSLNITKHVSGDYYIIPWIETQQQGLYKPSNFEKAFFVLDMAGSNVCGFGANGSGAAETITDVAYDSNQNILAHLDESGVIALMPLNGNDYTLEMNGTDLKLLKEGTVVNTIDLSIYLDDTNLARLVNGVLDASTGIASFIRDDGSTFTVDFSSLLDTNDIDYISNIQLVNTDLQIQGVGNAFSGVIDLSSIASTTPVMSSTITGTGKLWDDTIQLVNAEPVSGMLNRTYGVQFNRDNQLVINVPWQSGSVVVANPGNPIADLTSISVDGVSYGIGSTAADGNDFIDSVTLTGSDLIFTGSGGAFSGTIDLSGLTGTTYTASNGIELVTPTEFGLINIARINSSSIANPDHTDSFTVIDDITTNTKGQVTAVNVKTVTLPASGSNTTPVMTSTITGTGKLWDDAVQLVGAEPVSEVVSRTYGVQFNPDKQLVVNVPWESGSVIIANPGEGSTNLTSISIDGVSYSISTGTGADGNDFISNVLFNDATNELTFTGSGGAFNGVVDLSPLIDNTNLPRITSGLITGTNLVLSRDDASTITIDVTSLLDNTDTTYTAGAGLTLNTTEFSITDVTRTNTTNAVAPNHTDSFTVIDDITTNSKGQVTNVNVKTVTLPASGTGADGVITNVALSGTDLVFTGSNGGFNGTVSLSTLGPDGNATYTLGLVSSGTNDTVVKLTGANGGASSQFTLAGGTGISITENTSTNTIVIENTVTDTNDIDYISNVTLSGSSLDFTGIGNGFNGSVDLSSLSTVETLTRLSINANTLTYTDENGANTDIDLSLYLDDTNLARLVSGTLDGATGIATFSRDDASTFTVDFSSLIDVDTNDIDYVSTVALNGTSLDFTGVGNAFAGSIDLSSLSGATYTAGTGLTLNGSTFDANVNPVVQVEASSPVTAIRERVYDVQVNGSDQLVVNVPWTDNNTTYTAGTYLTLTGGAFNHDDTNRSNTTSTASPAAGASFTVVDSVVTNTTGHVTGVNTKTVTLPDAAASSTVACVGGLTLTAAKALTATLSPIEDATSKLGFISNAADRRHYNIVWTIEYGTSGSTGIKQLITAVRVTPNGGSAGTPITWNDSAYMVSEYNHTSTYSYSIANIQQGDMIEILVAGSTDVSVSKAHISATIVECEAFGSGEVTIPPSDSRGDVPGPTSYNYYNVLNCARDTSGIMAVPTSITQPLVGGTEYRYTLDNTSIINTPWDIEMMVRVQSIADPQSEDFTVTALTRETCPLT